MLQKLYFRTLFGYLLKMLCLNLKYNYDNSNNNNSLINRLRDSEQRFNRTLHHHNIFVYFILSSQFEICSTEKMADEKSFCHYVPIFYKWSIKFEYQIGQLTHLLNVHIINLWINSLKFYVLCKNSCLFCYSRYLFINANKYGKNI